MSRVRRADLLAGSPASRVLAPRRAAAKLVVLDDDPTGTQTVHGVPVLTSWEPAALRAELLSAAPSFYLLTNSRALPPEEAAALGEEIGRALAAAVEECGVAVQVLSRGDSTLRGHFPGETDALLKGLGWTCDATFVVPAFFAGGRITIGDVHYVAEGDELTPVGETEFARDAAFGFRSSRLQDWVEEKTRGRVRASEVVSIGLELLRAADGEERVARRLEELARGATVVVNAEAHGDLAVLTHALAEPALRGRRYLFRTAADFAAAYAGIEPRAPLAAAELVEAGSRMGGLLVAGSYVGKTTRQLDALFAAVPGLARVEIAVERVLEAGERDAELARCVSALAEAIGRGEHAALFTSRRLVTGGDGRGSLAIGDAVSRAVVEIVSSLPLRPRWLVAKGGITSSDVATRALGIRRAEVLGQALPGVPVWRTGGESRWPGLAYVVFPGNVGGEDALARLVSGLAAVR